MPPCGGLHGGEVGARARLGHGDAEDQLAADRRRHVLSLLLLVAIAYDVGEADVGMQRSCQAVSPYARDLLDDDGVVEEVAAGAAVFDGLVRAEQAFLAEPPPDRAVNHAALVPLGDFRLDLALGEPAHLIAEQIVVLAEDLASHAGGVRRAFHADHAVSIWLE